MTTPDQRLRKLQAARRRKLIKHLEFILENEPEVFNLDSWFSGTEEDAQQWKENFKHKQPLNCGTTACVVGNFPLLWPKTFHWSVCTGLIDVRNNEDQTVAGESLSTFLGGSTYVWGIIIHPRYYGRTDPTLSNVIARIKTLHASL